MCDKVKKCLRLGIIVFLFIASLIVLMYFILLRLSSNIDFNNKYIIICYSCIVITLIICTTIIILKYLKMEMKCKEIDKNLEAINSIQNGKDSQEDTDKKQSENQKNY